MIYPHYEEVPGQDRLVKTEKWKFDLSIDTPGCVFSNRSNPFSLNIGKLELDRLFLETLNGVCKSVLDTARLNMPEGE